MPDEIVTFIMLGNIYYSQDNYIDALTQYQKILWIDPNNTSILFQQALCFFNLNYYEDAKFIFNKILTNIENHYNSLYYLAMIEYQSKNYI